MSRIDPSTGEWQSLAFRDRRPFAGYSSADPAATRFAIGMAAFLVVALLYPFYSYWVQSRLLAAELVAGLQEADGEMRKAEQAAQAQLAAATERRREQADRDRLRRVTVAGVSEHAGYLVAIVSLGDASLAEATPTICAQVSRMRRQASFVPIQVRRHRGKAPALTVGTIRCDA